MTRTILLSVRPEHAIKILSGDKTLELRKSVPKDFVGWVYIYCTKSKPYLGKNHDGSIGLYNIPAFGHFNKSGDLNGKVVARFWFDEYDRYYFNPYQDDYRFVPKSREILTNAIMPLSDLCLTLDQVNKYGKEKDLFVWHIKRLEIFNKPKDLWDFHTRHDMLFLGRAMARKVFQFESVYKAPQSWQYVWEKE